MECQVMALRQGGECFTKWIHVENGLTVVRRLHRIILQTRKGQLEVITGDKLPDSIQTWIGHPYVGVNLAQILLSGKSLSKCSKRKKCQLPATASWWLPREAKRRLEALHQAIECSTRLDHVENEEPLHRQIRRIEVLAQGISFSLTGKRLPEYIAICTGSRFKGRHTAQILLRPESACDGLHENSVWPTPPPVWPELRDVVHIGLGVVGFLLIRFLLELIISVG